MIKIELGSPRPDSDSEPDTPKVSEREIEAKFEREIQTKFECEFEAKFKREIETRFEPESPQKLEPTSLRGESDPKPGSRTLTTGRARLPTSTATKMNDDTGHPLRNRRDGYHLLLPPLSRRRSCQRRAQKY
jgi:hypothetical protein